jgi:hypothetical protein
VNEGFTDRDLTPESMAKHADSLAVSPSFLTGAPDSPFMANLLQGFTDPTAP